MPRGLDWRKRAGECLFPGSWPPERLLRMALLESSLEIEDYSVRLTPGKVFLEWHYWMGDVKEQEVHGTKYLR